LRRPQFARRRHLRLVDPCDESIQTALVRLPRNNICSTLASSKHAGPGTQIESGCLQRTMTLEAGFLEDRKHLRFEEGVARIAQDSPCGRREQKDQYEALEVFAQQAGWH